MKRKMYDLKPCPFCGAEVDAISLYVDGATGPSQLHIECRCGIEFNVREDDLVFGPTGRAHQLGMNAVEKWNRRQR